MDKPVSHPQLIFYINLTAASYNISRYIIARGVNCWKPLKLILPSLYGNLLVAKRTLGYGDNI